MVYWLKPVGMFSAHPLAVILQTAASTFKLLRSPWNGFEAPSRNMHNVYRKKNKNSRQVLFLHSLSFSATTGFDMNSANAQ